MRRQESHFRSDVVKALAALDAFSVENAHPHGAGGPDAYCIGGHWIEFKKVSMPIRSTSVIAVPHYTPKQRAWALRHTHRGGNVWMIIEIGQETFILPGAWAAEHLGRVTYSDLRNFTQDSPEALWVEAFDARWVLRFFMERNNAKD